MNSAIIGVTFSSFVGEILYSEFHAHGTLKYSSISHLHVLSHTSLGVRIVISISLYHALSISSLTIFSIFLKTLKPRGKNSYAQAIACLINPA
jgi:hypothetical protein